MTFQTIIGELPYMKIYYLEVPKEVVLAFGGFKQRVICTVNGQIQFQSGFMALGEGKGYLTFTKKRIKQLGLDIGDEVTLHLEKDESEFGMPFPEELTILLEQDEEGHRRFHLLTAGKQRYIIHYVNSVKNPDKRIERAVMLITNLKKMPEDKFDFGVLLGKR